MVAFWPKCGLRIDLSALKLFLGVHASRPSYIAGTFISTQSGHMVALLKYLTACLTCLQASATPTYSLVLLLPQVHILWTVDKAKIVFFRL